MKKKNIHIFILGLMVGLSIYILIAAGSNINFLLESHASIWIILTHYTLVFLFLFNMFLYYVFAIYEPEDESVEENH